MSPRDSSWLLKEWLSCRELKVLGRSLDVDEVKRFSEAARRMAAILKLRQ